MGFCLVPVFGFAGACLSNPAAWIAADLFLITAYFHVMQQLQKKMPGADAVREEAEEEAAAKNGKRKGRKALHALG